MFHKEGFKIILITFVIVAGVTIATDIWITTPWLSLSIKLILLGFLILILQFYLIYLNQLFTGVSDRLYRPSKSARQ